MAELTAKGRKQINDKSFCGPDRSYPAHDARHARNCISRAAQQLKAGNLTQAQHDRIVACCRRKLTVRSMHPVDPDALAWVIELGEQRDLVDLRATWVLDLDPENRIWPIPTQELELRGTLERVPGKQNWIDKLPAPLLAAWHRSIIYRAAIHMTKKGMPVGMAIASAINWAKYICTTGDVKQWKGPQSVKPSSVAECCAAVAIWSSMKAAA